MVNCELDRSPIACKAAELELWTRVRASLWIACMDALGALLAIVADGMDRAIRARGQSLFLYVRITVRAYLSVVTVTIGN